jgi:hypothetical protein
MDDPRHDFLSAGEVMARYGWARRRASGTSRTESSCRRR